MAQDPDPGHRAAPGGRRLNELEALRELAVRYGVQLAYDDVRGAVHEASPEALLAVLRSLGAPVGRIADATDALRAPRPTARIEVVWDGEPGYGHDHDRSVISAPGRAPQPDRGWGVFLPLHALRTSRSTGVGDLTDLRALLEWTASLGGSFVGTLPLLPTTDDDPSPYAPTSRLFFNELYLDPTRCPGFEDSREARDALPALLAEAAKPEVDHARVAALKRAVVQPLVRPVPDASPLDDDYAAFRGDVAYHRFVQWQLREQMDDLLDAGAAPYADMPLGVHPDGFDASRFASSFASGVTVGAPPDPFFEGGQEWGFRPPHPEGVRVDGYAYPIACLRHLMRHASILRVDHVMGLHRLFWIPDGFPASEGVYVTYPAQEWYAVLLAEAALSDTALVGEDLGTVPDDVREAMGRHGLLRSYVSQFEFGPDGFGAVPPEALASLNTHDLPPYAAWSAATDGAPSLDEALAHIAASDAHLVMVSLEDLWDETRPQNVPGTLPSRNWRRRAAHTFDSFRELPGVTGRLGEVDRLRRIAGHA